MRKGSDYMTIAYLLEMKNFTCFKIVLQSIKVNSSTSEFYLLLI